MFELLYEKTYPKGSMEKNEQLSNLDVDPLYEKLRKIVQEKDYVFVPIREKNETAVFVIRKAIECAELYHIDLKIIKGASHFQLLFSFDFIYDVPELKALILMCDEMRISSGQGEKEISLALYYVTHQAKKTK